MFSKLKQVKTFHYSSLLPNWLESLLWISEDEPDFETSDILPAIKTWLSKKDRGPHQTCHKPYEKRKGKKRKLSSLSNDSNDDSNDNDSGNMINLFDDWVTFSFIVFIFLVFSVRLFL